MPSTTSTNVSPIVIHAVMRELILNAMKNDHGHHQKSTSKPTSVYEDGLQSTVNHWWVYKSKIWHPGWATTRQVYTWSRRLLPLKSTSTTTHSQTTTTLEVSSRSVYSEFTLRLLPLNQRLPLKSTSTTTHSQTTTTLEVSSRSVYSELPCSLTLVVEHSQVFKSFSLVVWPL
jgi:hypothetical protein